MSRQSPKVERLEDRTLPSATDYISSLYVNFLNRAPSQTELNSYLLLINQGTSSSAIAEMFVNSPEFINRQTRSDYEVLLGREPTDAELQSWLTMRQNGLSERDQTAAFLASDEFFARQGGTTQGWLNAVYFDVLRRGIDSAGQATYGALPMQSATIRAQATASIVFSSEASSELVGQAYFGLLHRAADLQGLDFWTGQLNTGLPVSEMLVAFASSPEYVGNPSGVTSISVLSVPQPTTAFPIIIGGLIV